MALFHFTVNALVDDLYVAYAYVLGIQFVGRLILPPAPTIMMGPLPNPMLLEGPKLFSNEQIEDFVLLNIKFSCFKSRMKLQYYRMFSRISENNWKRINTDT